MKILLYGSTYISELVEKELMNYFEVVGHVPSKNPIFKGNMKSRVEEPSVKYDIALSVQYDQKITNLENAYNLHTGLLPEYGGCDIIYHTLENKADQQGLTFHKMTDKFDAGEIITKITYPVLVTDKAPDLYEKICKISPMFAVQAIKMLEQDINKGKEYEPTLYKRGDVKDKEKYIQDKIDIENSLNGTLKVIVCALSDGRNERTEIKYPAHNQKILCDKDHFDMWNKMMEIELETNAGIPHDTLIVCNGGCANFFDKYDGMETKNGKIKVVYRENTGGSFGGYSYAYQNFKYKYYLFTEDDLFILGENYLKDIKKWFDEADCGFLALIGISNGVVYPPHAHGGIGLVPRYVLDKIAENGELPYHHDLWCRPKAIRDGEVALSQKIVGAGFKLAYKGKEEWHLDNHIMPYYDLCI